MCFSYGNISLKLLMKLCIYFGICLSLKWLYLKLTFLLFSNLGLITAQQTRNHISCFTAGGLHISCRHISNMHTVGEGPGETPSALRCLSLLINSFLKGIKHLLKTSKGALLLSPSDVYVRSFLYVYYTLIKDCYTKSSK